MTLSEYLKGQIKEKNLTAKEIERRSGGKVTDTHIGAILAGKTKNPTVKIIVGLAEGLDVDPVEVFKVATGVGVHQELWTPHSLARTIDTLVDNSELGRLVQLLVKQKPAKVKALLKTLEFGKD
jgi:transcriptional regulator with XRE-family HTH domain